MAKKNLGLTAMFTPSELALLSMAMNTAGKKQLKSQIEFEKKKKLTPKSKKK